MPRHVAITLALLMMLIGAPMAAADREPIPHPGPVQCLTIGEIVPPDHGDLPALNDPITGTSEGLACDSGQPVGPTRVRPQDGDGQTRVADQRTDWEIVSDGMGGHVLRLNSYAIPVGNKILSEAKAKYKLSVSGGANNWTFEFDVEINRLQSDGRTTEIRFNQLETNSRIQLDLVGGGGRVRIDPQTTRSFTFREAAQGEQTRP